MSPGPRRGRSPSLTVPGSPRGVLDDVIVLPWNDIDQVAPVIRAADDLAAVILEPIPFSNIGGEEPDPEFLRALRELTWERDVLLVFDEVITGFRLDLGGAAARYGFAPDLHCFGKAAGGGFPVGVFGGRRDVMEAVVRPRPGDPHSAETIFQSGTFSGAPPAMAAGIAMLHELERTDALAVANARAETVREGWRAIIDEIGLPAQVTGMSSWLGISFTDRQIRTLRDALTADRARARSLLARAAGGWRLPRAVAPGLHFGGAQRVGCPARARGLRAGAARDCRDLAAVDTDRLPVA